MTQEHPITPPPELVQRLYGLPQMRAIEAAFQSGADQELEAICEFLGTNKEWNTVGLLRELRAARRPKPPSLKEQSLKHLEVMERDGYYLPEILQDLRRALEQLND
jgi:hypothetical protein